MIIIVQVMAAWTLWRNTLLLSPRGTHSRVGVPCTLIRIVFGPSYHSLASSHWSMHSALLHWTVPPMANIIQFMSLELEEGRWSDLIFLKASVCPAQHHEYATEKGLGRNTSSKNGCYNSKHGNVVNTEWGNPWKLFSIIHWSGSVS